MWDAEWDVRPDSSYQFLFETSDEGTVTATTRRMGIEINDRKAIGSKGIYRNVTPDSFEMSHPVFQMLRFERVESTRMVDSGSRSTPPLPHDDYDFIFVPTDLRSGFGRFLSYGSSPRPIGTNARRRTSTRCRNLRRGQRDAI